MCVCVSKVTTDAIIKYASGRGKNIRLTCQNINVKILFDRGKRLNFSKVWPTEHCQPAKITMEKNENKTCNLKWHPYCLKISTDKLEKKVSTVSNFRNPFQTIYCNILVNTK